MALVHIGKKLKKLRERAGLPQRKFAVRLGISWRALQDYERGITAVDGYKAKALLDAARKLARKGKS